VLPPRFLSWSYAFFFFFLGKPFCLPFFLPLSHPISLSCPFLPSRLTSSPVSPSSYYLVHHLLLLPPPPLLISPSFPSPLLHSDITVSPPPHRYAFAPPSIPIPLYHHITTTCTPQVPVVSSHLLMNLFLPPSFSSTPSFPFFFYLFRSHSPFLPFCSAFPPLLINSHPSSPLLPQFFKSPLFFVFLSTPLPSPVTTSH